MANLYAALQRRRLSLLFACFFLMMAGITIISPHLTPLAINYFASLDCGKFSAGEAPLQCIQGSSTAVRYVSITSFFSNAVLGLLVSPVVGWLSDSYGRKPFFLAALVLNALPSVWVATYLHMDGTISFLGFYVLDGLKGMVMPLALTMSATADVAEPELRTTIFSLIMVELSIAMILAAGFGGLLTATAAANTSVTLFVVSIVLYASFMPETLTDEVKVITDKSAMSSPTRASMSSRTDAFTASNATQTLWGGLKETLSVLTRSELFFKLALIMAASGIVFECFSDLLFNYLTVTMGFGASQNAKLLMALGISSLAVQAFLLPALLKVSPEKWILVSSLIASACEMLGFVLAPAMGEWAVYTSVVVGAPGSMSFPVISGLKSVHAGPEEQGKVQGALFAARGAAQGAGPLLFSVIFSFFSQKGSSHYFPGAPILGLAVIMVLGAVTACSMRVPSLPNSAIALQHIAETGHADMLCEEERVELLHHSDAGLKRIDTSTAALAIDSENHT